VRLSFTDFCKRYLFMHPIKLNQFDVDAVLLDLDGTMVDTLGDFVAALHCMLADLPPPWRGQSVDRATIARLVGKGSENLVKSVLAHVAIAQGAPDLGANETLAQVPGLLFEQALESYQRHYPSVNGRHATVYPGVREGLDQLQAQGLKMACVTNKPTRFAQALLQAKGLDGYFQLTVGGDACARKKPDPEPLVHACAALGVHPLRTLMVGDSSNDAQAARGAGCPVVLVTYGYNHGQAIRSVDADGFTDSLHGLV